MKTNMEESNKKKIVVVSGGFDPIHIGHVRMFQEAKKLGDELVVIVNNDNWIKFKRGRNAFMPEKERKEIVEAIAGVDKVVLTQHELGTKDLSICKDLERIKPNIFANGGDRTGKNIPELDVCKKINCEMVFNIGREGKIQSSSWLLESYNKKKS